MSDGNGGRSPGDPTEGFFTRLTERRRARGWTQADVAARTGLSRAAVSAIETGRVVPSAAAALSLARAFGCPVESLFGLHPGATDEGSGDGWAWRGATGERRFWAAEVGGRVRRYPVETTAVGTRPHDGVAEAARGRARVGRGTAGRRSALGELPPRSSTRLPADPRRTLVLAGCDPAAGLLAERLSGDAEVRLLPYVRSSRRALELLRAGLVHAAGLHLAEDPTGNAALTEAHLGPGYRLLHVARWTEGLALAPGLGVRSVERALSAGLRWVGREEGSGARACLDVVLQGRAPPPGCEHAASDHRAVAEAIRTGWAQAGVCVQLAAEERGLDFLPVRRESYDLCFAAGLEDDPRITALLDAVRAASFRRLVADLPGYDSRRTGELA